jgi:acid phosphatase
VLRRLITAVAGSVLLVASGCDAPAGTPLPTVAPARTPAPVAAPPADDVPEHIVVVVFENKGIGQIIGSGKAPAFDALARRGAVYTRSYAVTHPSQPNYLALFSGSTQGVTNDSCPHTFTAMNLGRQLLDAGRTFTGYAEALPHSGFAGCGRGRYARKHAPWTDFANLPADVNQPYTAFPSDFTRLPSVAFVIPDLCDDMHDCPIATGDRWLADHLSGYATWAQTHHSLLIVTFDEDDSAGANLITTIVTGQGVPAARPADRIDHYTVLRTIEACFGLAPLGVAAARAPLPGICG